MAKGKSKSWGDNFIRRSVCIRASVAVGLVGVALGLSELIWLGVDRPISSPLFAFAIIVSAWLCGFELGILTALLSAVAIDYFLLLPAYQFSGTFDEIIRLCVFTGEGAALCWFIDFRRQAVDKITETGEQLRALTIHQQNLREEEQKRISLEIHDELGQAMTGLKMDVHTFNRVVGMLGDEIPKTLVSDKVSSLLEQVEGILGSIRRIAKEMRPSVLDDFGLIAAMEWQAKEFERRTGIECKFDSDFDSLDISPEANTAVYRIFQEALTNITRHAKASAVKINIGKIEGNTTLSITDNGVGIKGAGDPASPSLGILGMRERSRLIGAEFAITPAIGGGTSVTITLPRTNGPDWS